MKKLISLLLALVLCMSLCAAAFADVYTDAGFIKKIPMKPKYTEAVENHLRQVMVTDQFFQLTADYVISLRHAERCCHYQLVILIFRPCSL